MQIRPLDRAEIASWVDLRAMLWPEQPRGELESEGRAAIDAAPPSLVVFVADDGARLLGFIEISLRGYAEGCDGSPVPYVEGWYVREDHRRRGIGTAMMRAAEDWARSLGCREMASDTWIDERNSLEAHQALGFEVVDRCIHFRKSL